MAKVLFACHDTTSISCTQLLQIYNVFEFRYEIRKAVPGRRALCRPQDCLLFFCFWIG